MGFAVWSIDKVDGHTSDSTHLLMRACISLKIDKLNEVIHENSKNLNCEIDVLGTCKVTRAIMGINNDRN